jgi:hypothetical protein
MVQILGKGLQKNVDNLPSCSTSIVFYCVLCIIYYTTFNRVVEILLSSYHTHVVDDLYWQGRPEDSACEAFRGEGPIGSGASTTGRPAATPPGGIALQFFKGCVRVSAFLGFSGFSGFSV